MADHHAKLVIIGSGPAGYSAAIYAARAALQPVLFEGIEPGGQLTITTDVENYPGFADVIQGPWLMEQMKEQAVHVGTDIIYDIVKNLDLSKRPFTFETDSGEKWSADSIILSTGAKAKWLGLASEKKYTGFGVSACATCDGFFFKDKEIFVIGGGTTAVEEALFLTKFAAKVTLIHRRDSLRAEKILQERLFAHPKIEIIWDHVLEEITGEDNPVQVTGIRIRNVKSGQVTEQSADGVFIAIGHEPQTELVKKQLTLNPASGTVSVTPGGTATSVPGVFAAGDIADPVYRQAVTAAGMGCMAALDAEKFLAESEAK